jgi:hypothetical protein
MHWQEARVLNLPYWCLPTRTVNARHDLRVDVGQVLGILQGQLGRPQAEDSLELVYSWS